MNALLLITDLEEADLEDLYADVKVYQGGECVQMSYGNPLIKVPKKRIVLEHRIGGYTVNGIEMTVAHGYNACIDEILGENYENTSNN